MRPDLTGAWVVARKEMTEHFISKRFFVIAGLFAVSLTLATILGPRLFKGFIDDIDPSSRLPSFLSLYLNAFQGLTLVILLAIILSADAVVSEWKDRTLFLLLSKPISRSAMLLGKVVAAYATVLLVFVSGFLIGVVILLFAAGVPDAEGWGRVLGGLGILALGLLPLVALGVMFSSLFKSPATSYAVTILLVIVIYPTIFTILTFIVFLNAGAEAAQASQFLQYAQLINPTYLLSAATAVMTETTAQSEFGLATAGVGAMVTRSLIAMAVHVAAYVGISAWIVNRRDYG